ncbi:hypothetical protein IPF16_21175 [Escherichia coli]|uniref:hypothetical protein n=1 Tax=Escherichia coli TaxID=562 RepID=UPI000A5D925F|nr:hypothetical protein [Escherichia coli]HBR2353641.1 hypothetical protein [Klebsiella pneumoniae]EFV6959679.1 hypothetical protein [Escherichia coli]EHJ4588629.1 hypothetical protein [Escherichia coli]EJV3550293.1 hypothetical protein [Escherichia coli]MCC4686803.1 hypothetical protein [Escherichia coli]
MAERVDDAELSMNQAFIVTLNVRNGTGKSRPQNSVNMACDRQDLTDYVALY